MDDPDALLELLATTRAIRRIRPDPVPDEDLARMLFAATRAPSGSNRQPFRMLVLRDGPKAAQAKALLGDAFRRGWQGKRRSDGWDGAKADTPKARTERAMQEFVDNFERIPVVVLACLNRYRAAAPTEGGSVYPAVQNLLLAARALGYGGVITQWHMLVEPQLREVLGIPQETAIHATVPIGRPVGRHGPVRRRPMRELVYEDEWEQPPDWAVDPPGTSFTSAGPPRA